MTRLRLTLLWCPCVLAMVATPSPAAAQEPESLFESRFVEANGIRLQYMDFGGSGLPLIFVQDIHNYFEHEELFFVRDLQSAFYTRFTDDHRVLATVKRGYGESDDPGWGHDVATHSEDLLGLMDALGIRRAVLVGRMPATQDLTWIAEHHPERVAGLVYLGNPVVIRSSQHPEARLFDENYARGSCDLQEQGIALVGARGPWRPHFLDDETVRIDVPALRFTHPVYDRRSMDLRRLDRLDAIAAAEPECPGKAQSLEYFRALAEDPTRRAALREALEASDLSVPIDEGIERAFGASMRTVVEPDWEGDLPALHDFIEPHIRRFLAEVAAVAPFGGVLPEGTAPLDQPPQAGTAQEWTDPSPQGHDPTDIDRLRMPELCSFSGLAEAMERTFENPELVRQTQWHTDEDGVRRPFALAAAGASIDLPTPDYSGVVAPALGIYYVPERTEDLFMGLGAPAAACVTAFHRYIHGGIAAFVEGVEQATVIPLSETNHNIHLASPAALEAVMRQWLDSHAAPDPTDRLVREHMEALGIPAVSLVVMRNGVVLREAAYGRASLELDVPATPATVFPYASMAKVFTGTAVLRLVQGGRLMLDGRIADLLANLPPAWSDVTVRQLLANTSGLPDLHRERVFQNPFVSSWASRAAALETLTEQPVERAPGTGFSYNQTNYLLLGMLLDRVDGRTVDEYVAEEIAGPLGLTSLAYGDSRVSIAGRAQWYSRLDFSEGEPRVVAPQPLWIEYPAFLHTGAGLNGTARDLARFVDALASGRLLDDAHRQKMWTAVPLADGTTLRFEDGVTGAGLGWWVHDDPTHPWVGMGGAASGVVRHFVNEGLTIAVLTNLQGAEPEAIASGIADIYLRTAAMNEGNGALAEPRW